MHEPELQEAIILGDLRAFYMKSLAGARNWPKEGISSCKASLSSCKLSFSHPLAGFTFYGFRSNIKKGLVKLNNKNLIMRALSLVIVFIKRIYKFTAEGFNVKSVGLKLFDCGRRGGKKHTSVSSRLSLMSLVAVKNAYEF